MVLGWVLFLFVGAFSTDGRCAFSFDIQAAALKKVLLVVLHPHGTDDLTLMENTVASNLGLCRFFNVVTSPTNAPQARDAAYGKPDYAKWHGFGVQYILVGIHQKGHLSYKLYDVEAKTCLGTVECRPNLNAGHALSDFVYEKITKNPPFFQYPLVYIQETSQANGKTRSELRTMFLNGSGNTALTHGKESVYLPTVDPKRENIAYLSMHGAQDRLRVFNMATKNTESLTVPKELRIVSGPVFSPDGQTVYFAAYNKQKETLLCAYTRGTVRTVYKSPAGALCNAVTLSPNGSKLAFSSNRSGSSQIYILDQSTGGIRQLSAGDGEYFTCSWSPQGDWIAFVKRMGRRFLLGLVNVNTQQELLLTRAYLIDRPCWLANGRGLVFPVRHTQRSPMTLYVWFLGLRGSISPCQKLNTPGQDADQPHCAGTLR